MSRQRKTTEEKLAELEAKKHQLDERIKREAAKLRAVDRKKDTRRKILAGAIALEHAAHDAGFREALERQISHNVKRADDRALFDLPPLPTG